MQSCRISSAWPAAERRPAFGVPERFRASRSEEGVSQIELDHLGALGGRSFVEPAPTNRRRIAVNAPEYSRARTWGKRVAVLNPTVFGRYHARTLADTVNN